ncbi:LOW QUALITY PROTEIN: Hypothetical protein PHPALM_7105 [Phytophthora palmivora]|uniref:HAT C-terminal dimerisation domain-containing protein n=1 Tax=Phytophthora palmivora TaxID=4796 RepID=A0A2P4YDG6_9STRA|nr:LOW QUALITY PROTEIN: Hypothetical protein PHPALM_7105 [Phytophthora palmivora]
MDSLRNFAIDELDTYLVTTTMSLERNELDAVRKVVQHFRTMTRYSRKSPKGQNRLGQCHVSVRDIKPSEILRRFIVLEQSLVNFFAYLKCPEGRIEFKDMESNLRRPKASDWLTIKCVTTLLALFAVATEVLSRQDYPSVLLVLRILFGIRKHLSRTDLFASHVAAAGEEAHVAEAEVAYLDLRVGKRMPHLGASQPQSAADALIAAACDLARELAPTRGELTQIGIPKTSQEVDNMIDMFSPVKVFEQQTELEKNCIDEFTRVSDIKTVLSSYDPLMWWYANHSKYTNLSRLARKWLGAVATSIPSERAFSTSENMLTAKRSSLAPGMVRDLVFIAHNWRIDCA